MKNLMIVIQSLEGGGQERIAALTTFVLKDEYNIYFVVFSGKDKKYEVSEEIKYIDLSIPHTNNVLLKIFFVLIKTVKLRRLKKKYRIDTTISIGRPANIVNCLSKVGDKVISSVRNSSYIETEKQNLINKFIYQISDTIVFISKGQRNKVRKYFPVISDKCAVIYNPCDIETINRLQKDEVELPFGDFLIISCARIEDVKCFINLCNSFKMARKNYNKLKLLIIGEGSKKEYLKKHIEQIGMEQNIILLGYQKNPFKFMNKCKAFVFSSASEGFGNALTEALACGLPVISTDYLFGAREILGEKSEYKALENYSIEKFGILTPAFEIRNDKQDKLEKIYSEAILRLITDKKLYKELKSKANLRARDFSIDNYKKSWIKII